ncbi:hypothetical protein ACSLOP_30380, partial [Escherichia coli]
VGTNFSGSTFNNVKTTTAQLIKTPTKWTNNTLKYWFSSCNKRYILQPGITKRFIFKIKTTGFFYFEIVIISAM